MQQKLYRARCTRRVMRAWLMALCLVACSSAPAATPPSPTVRPQGQAQVVQATTEPSVAPSESDLYPLSTPGPYHVGTRKYAAQDPARENRKVSITMWYPAVRPEGATHNRPSRDAAPDRSGASYPLLLSSTKVAQTWAPYLVSHGFAWASVNGLDTWDFWGPELVAQPLDLLFALREVASTPLEGLEGMIDVERTGVIGYSFDGYNALALSGARIDEAFYLERCANQEGANQATLSTFSSQYHCPPARAWADFVSVASEVSASEEDGLWRAMTDERIRAVMPMAGEGWWLFGGRGLASVNRPVLVLIGTEDELYPENKLIVESLGTPEKTLIAFVGRGHEIVYNPQMIERMAHFAVAFFGLHLQGRKDLAWYLSPDFVAQHDDLVSVVLPGD